MEASKFRKPKLEGVTRTIFNLEDHSLSQGNGKKRVIHVSIEEKEGKKLYFSYAIKMVNKTTFSMRCNQNRSTKNHALPFYHVLLILKSKKKYQKIKKRRKQKPKRGKYPTKYPTKNSMI